jgi:hypothetical protein
MVTDSSPETRVIPTPRAGDAGGERCRVEVALYSNRFPHYDQCERRAKHHVTAVQRRGYLSDRSDEIIRTVETHLCTQHRKQIESGRSVPVIIGLRKPDGKYHTSRYETVAVNGILDQPQGAADEQS